jgi:hypothetical protein
MVLFPEATYISPAVGLLAAMLGIYVLLLNHYLSSTRAFFVTMLLGSATAFLNFFLVNAPGEEEALILARLVLFLLIAFHASILYLTAYLPYKRDDDMLIVKGKEFLIFALVSSIIASALVLEVSESSYGWGVPESPAFFAAITLIILYTAAAVWKLYTVYRENDVANVRRQCIIMIVGVLSPVAWDLVMVIEERIGTQLPPEMVIGYVPTMAAFLYVIFRHRLFLISPAEDKEVIALNITMAEENGVKEGCCYLIEGKKSDEAYRLLLQEIAGGAQALIISRTHPDIVREQYGLVKTPLIWLASQPGPERMDPTSLSMLQHTVTEFAKRGEDTLIFLDGLEYLITNNPMDKVLKLIYAMKDELLLSSSRLMVPLDPEVLEEKDLALFEREFEVIDVDKDYEK